MAEDIKRHKSRVLRRGGYTARFAAGAHDLMKAQRLRHQCFIKDAGLAPRANGLEQDAFDPLCDHVLVEDAAGDLVCCFRLLHIASGADLATSYSAQFYDLTGLSAFGEPMLELGRFCVSPTVNDPDVLRIAWGTLAAVVDERAIGMLFGCSSFAGTDVAAYDQAFDILAAQHQAPAAWMPAIKAKHVVPFAQTAGEVTDRKTALGQVPALLKTYLSMGGWVSDHAVIDPELNTLHVFTGLEIALIPPARAKALRAVAQQT